MFNKLYSKFFGYRIGQVVRLADFDNIGIAVDNPNFKAFDCIKGKYGYWIILNSDLNRYVVSKKYRL